ncbi:MAG: ATP-binding protein [Sandaracinaceae bacterium]
MAPRSNDPRTEPASRDPLGDASLLGRILEAVPSGIVHVDPDGAIRRANQKAQDFLGLSWDEVTQRFVNDFDGETFHEDGSPFPADAYPVSRCLASGQPDGPTTLGVRQPNGAVRWGIFTAVPAPATDGEGNGAVVTFVDITERRRRELRARAEHQLLHTARLVHFDDRPETTVAVMHEPLMRFLEITRSRAGFVARVDPSPPVPSELIVLAREDLDHPDDTRRSVPPVPLDAMSEACIRERKPQVAASPGTIGGPFRDRPVNRAIVLPLVAGERTLGLLGLADAPSPYDDKLIAFLEPLLDATTDLLAALAERRERTRLEARLARAERLASVGTLAAGMAHEINNPLAYLQLNLEACLQKADHLVRGLKAESAPAEAHTDTVAAMRRHAIDAMEGAERVQRIVRDLMTFARVSETERGLVDINAAVHVALKMSDHEIKYRAKLVCELGDIAPVEGNEGRLSQVFLNLLLNAARAIEEGDPERHEIRVRTWQNGDKVQVEVSDTGSGIAPEHANRLFEPFFSTRAPGAGSGLGLSICHNVVTAHGGAIDVDSTQGQGSRFTVTLPAATRTVAAGRSRDTDPAPSAGGTPQRACVVLIDDEPMVVRVLAQLLARRFDVVTAEGVESATSLLADTDRVDVILCDMMMLDGTGMDLHAWVREHRPELEPRMIFMTGGSFTPRAREFLRETATHQLQKPFPMKDLDALIAKIAG